MGSDFYNLIIVFRDAYSLVVKYYPQLNIKSALCKKRHSIVRTIGTALPLKPVSRMWFFCVNSQSGVVSSMFLGAPYDDLKDHFSDSRFLYCQSTPRKSQESQSVPKKSQEVNTCNTKLEEIECELARLRAQVAQILSVQAVACPENKSTVEPSMLPPTPPPPPPPPPPLPPPPQPPASISAACTPIKKISNASSASEKNRKKGGNLDDVLRELLTGPPKLRKIKRSPGGRPLRSPRLHDDPAQILADVLKRRFAAIHYINEPEKDECSDHSFNSTASDYAIAAT